MQYEHFNNETSYDKIISCVTPCRIQLVERKSHMTCRIQLVEPKSYRVSRALNEYIFWIVIQIAIQIAI